MSGRDFVDPADALRRLRSEGADAIRESLRVAVAARRDEVGGHRAWAAVLAEAGLPDEAQVELQLAVRDDPADADAMAALAAAVEEQGDTARALRLFLRALGVVPSHRAALDGATRILAADGAHGRADEVIEAAERDGFDPVAADRLRSALRADRGDASESDAGVPGDVSGADAARFAAMFRGREDVYARQWVSKDGRTGYSPVREPFTPAVARNHLVGNVTVGVYPVRVDGTSAWFAVDLDVTQAGLDEARADPARAGAIRDALASTATTLLDDLRALAFDPILENSGRKGRHLWVFLATPIDAAVLVRLGSLLLRRWNASLPDGLHLEFFPKQSRVAGDGLGNLIKLPLGVHRRTGRWCSLLADDGRTPLVDPFARLRNVRTVPREAVLDAVEKLRDDARSDGAPIAPVASSSGLDGNGDVADDADAAFVLLRCAVLREIVRSAVTTRRMSHDQAMVLRHTLGHFDGAVPGVNAIFAACADLDDAALLVSPLRGYPMSCPRIRKRVPEVTRAVGCGCAFEFAPERYPTPALHLLDRPVAVDTAPPPDAEAPEGGAGERFAAMVGRRESLAEGDRAVIDAALEVLARASREAATTSATAPTSSDRAAQPSAPPADGTDTPDDERVP